MSYVLKRKFHKKGYIINGVFAGTSLVEGTEVSGFSSVNNYILVPAIPANTTNFEIFLKVKFSNFVTNQHFFNSSYTYSFLLSINASGKLFTHISSNGTSWDIASNIQGVSTLSKDVWYYIKCSFNGSEYKIQLSSDNKIWTDEITIQSTVSLASVGGGRIGSGWYDTPGTYITCDFSQCYININGELWWKPYKRCKYDHNFTTVGTPSISNAPGCEVSGFSTSNYIKKELTFDINGDWEVVTRAYLNGLASGGPTSMLFGITKGNTFGINFYVSSTAVRLAYNHTPNSGWTYTDISVSVPTDRWFYIKYVKTGTTFTFYFSEDGELFEEMGSYTYTSTLYEADGFAIGCGYSQTALPSTAMVDLTQTTVKINNEPIWSCFKQTNEVAFKEDGTSDDYDFFDYKNYLPKRKFYKKGYINNFTTVGSPTFDGSVVSGFSTSNYLRINESFAPNTTDTWEKVVKFTTASDVSSSQAIIGDSVDKIGMILVIAEGKFITYISSGTSWDIASKVYGSHSILANTTYWAKVEFTGTAYNIYYSLNNIDFVLDITISSTKQISPSIIRLGGTASNAPVKGSIDLSESYIKINGELWWNPYKRCKYDYNFTTVGTPSISNPPSCEVSGFSSANYLSLSTTFKPENNPWEMVFKVRTPGSYTAHGDIFTKTTRSYYGIRLGITISGNCYYLVSSAAGDTFLFEGSGSNILPTNSDVYVKFSFTGSKYIGEISLDDGNVWIVDKEFESTTPLYNWESNSLIGYNAGTNNPFLGSIDLTQSYIKINGELWWSCFKMTNDVVYKEDGTLADYDFFDYKNYVLKAPSKKYYKYVPWEQPKLTSDTSYGTLTGGGYYTGTDNRDYYHISDGIVPTVNQGSDTWSTSNSATGWFNWELPEEIIITGIKVYNRSHTTNVDYELTGARFYTDDTKTTPIGEEFSIMTSQGIYELTTIPKKGIKTKNIYFYKTGNTYSGIGELEITAKQIKPATYKDYDFYEIEVK